MRASVTLSCGSTRQSARGRANCPRQSDSSYPTWRWLAGWQPDKIWGGMLTPNNAAAGIKFSCKCKQQKKRCDLAGQGFFVRGAWFCEYLPGEFCHFPAVTLPLDFGKIFTQVARGSRVPESPAGALTFETQTSFTFTLFIVARPDDVGNRKKYI